MKNWILSGFVVAAMLLVTACSKDSVAPADGEESIVTFAVQVPADVTVRSFGDGLSATTLRYFVYSDAGRFVSSGATALDRATVTVPLKLVGGKSYRVVFFACPDSEVYEFDAQGAAVEFHYEKMDPAKDYDCFYRSVDLTVDGTSSLEVKLTRPVAQLNWGTRDLNDPDVAARYGENGSNLRTSFVGEVYRTLELFSGEITNKGNVAIAAMPVIADPFPVNGGYAYLNTAYLLAPEGGLLITASLVLSNQASETFTFEVPNVPLKPNFRTNIYGSLLVRSFEIGLDNREEGGDAL